MQKQAPKAHFQVGEKVQVHIVDRPELNGVTTITERGPYGPRNTPQDGIIHCYAYKTNKTGDSVLSESCIKKHYPTNQCNMKQVIDIMNSLKY